MKKYVIALVAIVGMVAWSCSKTDSGSNGSLKQSVERGVSNISNAVTKISATTGYQLLTVNDAVTKDDQMVTNLADTITLEKVAGVYDFQPDSVLRFGHFCPYRLFKKTAESGNMVVNLPEQLLLHPRHLIYFAPKDTVYPNNFTITATDYYVYLNWWHNFEYKLTAGITLNNEDAGSIDVASTSKGQHTYANASKFTFKDGYGIAETWQDGDTATSTFMLTHNTDTLFKESSMFIWQEHHKAEKYYALTIGSVELKKSIGIDSLQVFVGGTLQAHAATIVDNESDTTASVCHKRDILLTYDDGTTAKLSDLIAPVREELQTLRDSLHGMFFAKHIVDYIAFSIYFEDHEFHP
jgi:hypothetical protein